METQSVPDAAGVKDGGASASGEYGFFALMFLVLITVTWVGVLSYEGGMHTEKTKRNGEAWAAWLTDNGAKRFEADYALAACAGGRLQRSRLKPLLPLSPLSKHLQPRAKRLPRLCQPQLRRLGHGAHALKRS